MEDDIGYIGGLLTPRENYIPNLQSAYGAIIQNAPDYQYFTAPLSNQGRDTASYGTTNQLVVAPDTGVRLVNNATGEVVFAGTGYEGAQQAIDAATALSSSAGGNANWDIQVTRPGSTNFETVSTERPDVSGLGIVADIALPVAASLLVPGGGLLGTILPAAGGSALSSVAQGRSLEDALLRAAIAAAGAGLGESVFSPAVDAVGNSIQRLADTAISNLGSIGAGAVGSTAGSVAGSTIGAAAPGFAGDIFVNALGQITPNLAGAAGSLLTNIVPSAFDATQLNNVYSPDTGTTTEQPGEIVVTAQPTVNAPTNVTTPGVLPPSTTTNVPPANPAEDIQVTAQTQTQPVTPTPVIIPPATSPTPSPTPTPPPPPADQTTPKPDTAEDIIVTASPNTPVITPPLIPPVFQPTAPTTPPADTTPPAKKDDFLGTGLTLSQFAAITGVGVDLLSKLLSGGSSTSTVPTTPYVSPFDALTTTGTPANYRTDLGNIDYERYGFGPEQSFFTPSYSNQIQYKPLI